MKIRLLFLAIAWLGFAASTRADDSELLLGLENEGASLQRDLSRKDRPVILVRYNLRQVTNAGIRALKEIEVLPAIEFLGSGDTELTAETLGALRGKSSLKRLSIAYAKISDESARILGTLMSLETLELQSQVEISARGFGEIIKLKNLKELTICDRLVNDAAIDALRDFKELKVLTLRSLFVSDESISSLRQMSSLSTLKIFAGERVSVDGLRQISYLHLRQLDITYFNASAAGLKELRKANSLQKLRLVDARKITDETIPILSEMSDLKDLEIVGSKLSKAGLKELKSLLPQCKITLVDF